MIFFAKKNQNNTSVFIFSSAPGFKTVSNLELGTGIYNSAAIFFDFNPPVITNDTQHRIGVYFLQTVGKEDIRNNTRLVSAFPNPSSESAAVWFPGANELCLHDLHGRLLNKLSAGQDGYFRIKKETLQPGMYFFSLKNGHGEVLGTGKVAFK